MMQRANILIFYHALVDIVMNHRRLKKHRVNGVISQIPAKRLNQAFWATVSYCFICLFILGQNDSEYLDGMTRIPFAGNNISLTSFLSVGSSILLLLFVYLQIYFFSLLQFEE